MSEEIDCDKQLAAEMNAIASMIDYADKQGLLTEVIYTLANSLLYTDIHAIKPETIPQQAACALLEWDC